MSRSGYSEYDGGSAEEQWSLVRWRGAVESALRGARGQAFLRELLAALDALPVKELAYGTLKASDGCMCALGTVADRRGLDCSGVDEEARDEIADLFGIAEAFAAEVMWVNDDDSSYWRRNGLDTREHREARFTRVRNWTLRQIRTRPDELLPLEGAE